MANKKKTALSVVLIALICVSMLLLFGGCKPDYDENGIRAKIYNKNSPNGYARVCEMENNGTNICVIPPYIQYEGWTYPVKEISPYGGILFDKGYSYLYEDIEELVIPETVTLFDIDSYTIMWWDQFNTLKRISVHPNNTTYSSVDGVLYRMGGRELMFYPPAKEGSVMYIGKDVTSINIAEYNFFNHNIKSVEVDESNIHFKAIDGVLCSYNGKKLIYVPSRDYTFNGYFAVPDGIEVITEYCFGFGQTNISHLYVPQSVSTVEFTVYEENGGYISHPFKSRIKHIYFESETAPDYLADLNLNDYYQLHFGVSREEFLQLADGN